MFCGLKMLQSRYHKVGGQDGVWVYLVSKGILKLAAITKKRKSASTFAPTYIVQIIAPDEAYGNKQSIRCHLDVKKI